MWPAVSISGASRASNFSRKRRPSASRKMNPAATPERLDDSTIHGLALDGRTWLGPRATTDGSIPRLDRFSNHPESGTSPNAFTSRAGPTVSKSSASSTGSITTLRAP